MTPHNIVDCFFANPRTGSQVKLTRGWWFVLDQSATNHDFSTAARVEITTPTGTQFVTDIAEVFVSPAGPIVLRFGLTLQDFVGGGKPTSYSCLEIPHGSVIALLG